MRTLMTWFGVIGISLTTTVHAAENQPASGASERCIRISEIKRTEVIDDQNILFHLYNKRTFNNHLPHSCSGLGQAKAFQYKTSETVLCNVDSISVLHNTAGSLLPGVPCPLGMFEPVAPKKNVKAATE